MEEIESSFCFGISFDCSQDVSSMERLIITVKFINSYFKIEEKFFKLTTVRQLDSDSIYQQIKGLLVKFNLFHKLVAVSTDGEPKIASQKKVS